MKLLTLLACLLPLSLMAQIGTGPSVRMTNSSATAIKLLGTNYLGLDSSFLNWPDAGARFYMDPDDGFPVFKFTDEFGTIQMHDGLRFNVGGGNILWYLDVDGSLVGTSLKIRTHFQAGTNLAEISVSGHITATGLTVTGNQTNLGAGYWGGGTNLDHFLLNTNFISGRLYTNHYGNTIEVSASVGLTLGAGSVRMELRVPGVRTNFTGQVSDASGLLTNHLAIWVPSGLTYTWTNTGALSSFLIGGQIFMP